jgi:hypothetical protein
MLKEGFLHITNDRLLRKSILMRFRPVSYLVVPKIIAEWEYSKTGAEQIDLLHVMRKVPRILMDGPRFRAFRRVPRDSQKKLNNDKHKFTHINFYSYNRSLPNKFMFNHQETEAEDMIHEAPVIVSLDIGPRVGESRVLACRDRIKCHLNRKILETKDQENSADGLYLHPPQTGNCCNCPKET